MPKSGAHFFWFVCFLLFFFFLFHKQSHKTLMLVVTQDHHETRAVSPELTDVSFLVLGLSSKPRALVVRAHTHIQILFCLWLEARPV